MAPSPESCTVRPSRRRPRSRTGTPARRGAQSYCRAVQMLSPASAHRSTSADTRAQADAPRPAAETSRNRANEPSKLRCCPFDVEKLVAERLNGVELMLKLPMRFFHRHGIEQIGQLHAASHDFVRAV